MLIEDLLTSRPGDEGVSLLVARILGETDADFLMAYFPPGSIYWGALRRLGFRQLVHRGTNFVVNPLREKLLVDPTRIESWAISLADLEHF